MKQLTIFLSALLLVSTVATARPSKTDCKAYAGEIKDLSKGLGVTAELTGRALVDQVETWIERQDPAGIDRAIERIEKAAAGVQECDAAGLTNIVRPIKGLSRKLESAALPWLRNASSGDSCQTLISTALRKRGTDLDGAIADLEQSVAECEDESWLPEAHQNLAAMYFERGDVNRGDHERAHEQMRAALKYGAGYDEDDRKAFRAILAKPAIEAGGRLVESGAHDAAKRHWRAYIDIFGTPSFDVLFDVSQVAQGAHALHELKDARYQLAMACLEGRDYGCVRESVQADLDEHGDDLELIREMSERVLGLAADCDAAQTRELFALGFDLLDRWHGQDPDSYQIELLVERTVLKREREERLALLRGTDKCWIPTLVAESLKENGQEYVAEVQIVATCGTGEGAEALLADFYMQEAHDRLDRLPAARNPAAKRAVLRDIERELLPKIGDPEKAADLRARLKREGERLDAQGSGQQVDKSAVYGSCTELLALIQWNRAREEDFDEEERDFQRECCGFLVANKSGWLGWMRSRPAGKRLADAEIEKKQRLMERYCQSQN